jgi:hypothetical protein
MVSDGAKTMVFSKLGSTSSLDQHLQHSGLNLCRMAHPGFLSGNNPGGKRLCKYRPETHIRSNQNGKTGCNKAKKSALPSGKIGFRSGHF